MAEEKEDLTVKDKMKVNSKGSGDSVGDSGVKERKNLNETIYAKETAEKRAERELNKKLSRIKGGEST